MSKRLDKEMVNRGITTSRSQAENYIHLGLVKVNDKPASKAGFSVSTGDKIALEGEQYVSRAALKLASIAKQFRLDFRDKTVLDVGSSTGGFTDYALQNGARKVIAVDVGTDQLHAKLRFDDKVELHEKTDIRDFQTRDSFDMAVADVSFISLKAILPAVARLVGPDTLLVIMCKPQFEAGKDQVNKGIIKNSAIRRKILKDFEAWLVAHNYMILDKADSQVTGTKGNIERFYKLKKAK